MHWTLWVLLGLGVLVLGYWIVRMANDFFQTMQTINNHGEDDVDQPDDLGRQPLRS